MRHISTPSNVAGSSSRHRSFCPPRASSGSRSASSEQTARSSEYQCNDSISNAIEEQITTQAPDDVELFERGPSLLPPVPRDEDKVVLTPVGDTQWKEEPVRRNFRAPNGIIGLLIRHKYPGIVSYKGRDIPADKWRHYNVIPATTVSGGQPLSPFQQVEETFWQYFKWADGKEVDAKRVVRNVIKNLIPQAIYEARIWSITSYHKKVLKQSITRYEACRKYHTVEQYMRRKPWWFQKAPEAWRQLAEKWCTEAWIRRSCVGRECKEKMEGAAHRQGSAFLVRYQRKLEEKEKRPISEIEAYAIGRMGNQEGTYCNPRAADKIEAYSEAAKAIHGEDFDWQNTPIDCEAAYMAGKGKPHGRYLVGNGIINTTQVLSSVQASTEESSGNPPRQRQRLDSTNATAVEQLQKELQLEREAREQDLQLEREARERELQLEREAREQELQLHREAWQLERGVWEQSLQQELEARQKEHEA